MEVLRALRFVSFARPLEGLRNHRYRRVVDTARGSGWGRLRLALIAFVLAWILGPRGLRDSVPILLVFLLALGLEIQFLVSALRGGGSSRTPDRGPQPVDREWYGFDGHEDDDDIDQDGDEDGDE